MVGPEHLPSLAAVVDGLLGVVAIGFALSRRRGFASTVSWVLAIIALPFAGAIGYLLLANPIVHRTRDRKQLASLKARGAAAPPPSPASEAMARMEPAARSVFQLAQRLTEMPATVGNRVEIFTDNHAAFEAIRKAILAARRFIWAEYYIVHDDSTGRRFLELLTERAREGLDVRLLYDAVGSSGLDGDLLEKLQAAGGRVEAFLPVNPLRRRWAVHLRNHRKILVADGEVGFTGGMNIGDEYSGGGRRRKARPWRDTHLSVHGPGVRDLASIFLEDWCFAADECLELSPAAHRADGSAVVSALPSGPDQETNATGLVYFSSIALAAKRCWVTSPYFIPDEPTLRALESAGLRGVDMRVLVPRMNDVPFLAPAMRSYYPRLVRAGVRVFEYLPTMLHAKTMVVDGQWGLIGSANLDMRSFRLNFEASLLVYDPAFVRQLEQQFEADLGASCEVSPSALADRSLAATLGEGAAQLLSPIL
jgi:cardiolipin synthase